jgi:transcriptional regulator with XRE-family HTH domain
MSENSGESNFDKLLSVSDDGLKQGIQEGVFLYPILLRTANRRGDSVEFLCNKLGVTKGYLRQIENGIRDVTAISEHFSRAVAGYLEIPLIVVIVLAGKISISEAMGMDILAKYSPNEAFEIIKKYLPLTP